MRRNTLAVIAEQTRAYKPPDHAGGEYDDGDVARIGCSCWLAVYQWAGDLASAKLARIPTQKKKSPSYFEKITRLSIIYEFVSLLF